MPLPDKSVPWPPRESDRIMDKLGEWEAWWSGDTDALSTIYGTGVSSTPAVQGFRGGVRRVLTTVRRWFWGEQQSASAPRSRLHVPLAADIASASADLLFSEPPRLTAETRGEVAEDGAEPEPDPVAQERLDKLWDDATHATLLEAAEWCAALGGVFLRIVWGPDRDRPWISAVHPGRAVDMDWQWGKLRGVTFWREVTRRGGTVWRHLERHELGVILHGLYEGTEQELGHVVPLTDLPQTAHLAKGLRNGNEVPTGVADRLTTVYIPNVRPNRVWRNVPEAAHLGRPDIAGVEQMLDALDLTWSSWVRDVDLGKARLIVPQEYLQSHGPGEGASVDLDREVYEGLNVMGSESGEKVHIEQVQFAIRVTEHQATHDALKAAIVGSAGYSVGTFGDKRDGGQGVTATEVTAELRRSLITRDRKIRYWRPELTDLLETWTHVDATQYSSGITPQRPELEWPDAVSVDPLTQAQTLRELDTARAISTEEKVRMLHPDWDKDRVDAEVARIQEEQTPEVPDPTALGGGGPEVPATPPEDEVQ